MTTETKTATTKAAEPTYTIRHKPRYTKTAGICRHCEGPVSDGSTDCGECR